MPTIRLPDEPNVEQLRKQAKQLRDMVRAGVPEAMAMVGEHHPAGEPAADARSSFPLSAAQLTVARRHGFASWPKLKRHIDARVRLTRAPDDVGPAADPVDELLRLACLTYADDDGPERWTRARELLASDPSLGRGTVHAAAATSDVDAVRGHLAADSTAADREGGPFRWTPLCYLAYSRLDPDVPLDAVLTVARLLLDAGADPNAGYLWHGLPTPFTVLTGAFGNGELGGARQPAHTHSRALGRVLLEAGADPNDGQTLYNRQFQPEDDHLELLFEFSLGRGDGGPWKVRLGDALDSPAEMLDRQMRWAIDHEMGARVELLVAHGVPRPEPTELELIVRALLTGGAVDDSSRRTALAARPGLIVWAVASGHADAVPRLVDLGFDLNRAARQDTPIEQQWETALHVAAGNGDLATAEALLALGADPNAVDARFDATPLGWAEHFEQPSLVALLAPLTRPRT